MEGNKCVWGGSLGYFMSNRKLMGIRPACTTQTVVRILIEYSAVEAIKTSLTHAPEPLCLDKVLTQKKRQLPAASGKDMALRPFHAQSMLFHTLHAFLFAVPAAQNIFSWAPVDLKQGSRVISLPRMSFHCFCVCHFYEFYEGLSSVLSITVTSASHMSEHQVKAH